jgi:hypothetical protein
MKEVPVVEFDRIGGILLIIVFPSRKKKAKEKNNKCN